MKKTLRFLLLALLVPLIFQSAKPASAQWFVGIHVNIGPPPLPVYDQPVCPGDGYIWTPGYWAWDADDGYYWVPGTWVMAPEEGFLWTPGYWGWGDGGYVWNEGYWGPHVGYYGGINYGFGYYGDGFWGGRWQGGHFFYNAAVWHVGGDFHNVYRDDTIIHNTTIINNHISYNGGQGGVDRRPTPQEESYRNERHVAPVSEQFRQVEAARGNPQLRASMNHGKPEIAATARPGEFSGGGVVQARQAGGEYHAQPTGNGGQPTTHEAMPITNEPRPVGGGGHPTPAHASDLPQHQPAQVPSTGNADRDRMYQQQQQQLADRQNQEHQQLQQRQDQEHQQAQQRNYAPQKQQQMEQKHQQQTQKMEQQHQQQTQRLQQRQAPRDKR